MTPRQLRYFVEIARTGSITTAAGRLHIAQPALSQHIAQMEQELGVPLLERHARGVRLTPEGQRLLDRATSILRQLERLPDDVRSSSMAELRGTVGLCIVESVAHVLAVPLLRSLAERAPQVRLQLSTGLSREAQALVQARRVDLALLPTAHELPQLQSLPVFEEDFCLFGLDLLCQGGSGPVPFAALAGCPLVVPDREHDLRKLVERTALAQGIVLEVAYELNNPELVRRIVQEGLAFAVMPRNAFPDAASRHVVARELVQPRLPRVQSLVWMAEHPLTPAGEAVRAAVLEVAGALMAEGTLQARALAAG